MPSLEGIYLPIFGIGIAHAIQALISLLVFKTSAKVPKFLFIIILSVIVLSIAFIVRLVTNADFLAFTGFVLIRQILACVIIYALLKLDKIEKCIMTFIWVQSIAALLIVCQFLTIPFEFSTFWDIKLWWIANTPDNFAARELILNKVRPPGLYSHAIAASYAMVWCLILVSVHKNLKFSNFFIILFGLAAIATLTRSSLPVVVIVFLVRFYKSPILWLILTFAIIVMLQVDMREELPLFNRLLTLKDASAASRLDFWYLGLVAGSQSWIGVVNWDAAILEAYDFTKNIFVLTNSPHNGLLTAYYSGGFLYVFICCLMFYPLFKNTNGKRDAIKSILYIIGYIIHASFHNNFVGIADWHALIVLTFIYRLRCSQF